MKTSTHRPLCIALFLMMASAVATAALGSTTSGSGTAKGTLTVNGKSTPLRYAYVVEKNALLRVIVSSKPIREADLLSASALNEAVDGQFAAVALQLDESRSADEAFYFAAGVPAGLSVRQTATFKPTKSTETTLAGRVTMKDPGFSFGFDATFEASITHAQEVVDPLPADASKADHALWRLKQMELEFDPNTYRSEVLHGNADAVKLFLEAGMAVDAADALRLAISQKHGSVVKILIAEGANVNARDEYGQSILMTASDTGSAELVKLLVDAKADVNIGNEYKITPLSSAAEQGHLDIVQLLLASGAKVNARSTAGGTALQVAVLRGYADIVRALIDAGADVQRDKAELLDLAKDHPEIVKMINDAPSKPKK
ncbi:MAG: ankyrin repeat domain-containing protein [Acidobacteriota bacterium]